jgi:PAS domain S-box-containing protein
MERSDIRQWAAKDVARLLALLEAELGYYREIAAALPIPLAVLSKDRSVVWTNRAFRRRFGTRIENLPALGVTQIPMRAWHDEDEAETLLVIDERTRVPAPAGSAVTGDFPAIFWRADVGTLEFRSVEGAAEEMFGHPAPQWLGRPGFFEERMHPEDRAPVIALYRAALSSGGEASAEYRTAAEGRTVWCRETIRVAGGSVIGVISDITRRKQLERQLLSAGRFEGLYSFAGRVAHDLNNPLMVVTGYAEELMQSLKAGDPLRAEAGEILAAARRIGTLAAQLTEFAKPHGTPASRVNLRDAILNSRSKITAAAGERVAVELGVNRGEIFAMANPQELGDVLSAVIAGTKESARDRSKVTIAWDVEVVKERLSPTALPPGNYACITIRDDGAGLDAQQAAGVFDPVLSKTAETAATGLAVAQAYSTVHEWGGDIAFSTEPGQGSVFTIYLPHGAPEQPAGGPARPAEPRGTRQATILVVDDEIGIRELIRKILTRERYRVLEAGSAEEALSAAPGQAVDLLITDVMLPGMQGPDLARRMQQMLPALKTLFISGYTGQERLPAGARFLAKPFTLATLLERVREALA